MVAVCGCAALTNPDPTNLATYCTEATGYRVGYLSMAYYGVCPKDTEGAFLAGLQRGRLYAANPPQALPYYERMEQTEKQLRAATSGSMPRDPTPSFNGNSAPIGAPVESRIRPRMVEIHSPAPVVCSQTTR